MSLNVKPNASLVGPLLTVALGTALVLVTYVTPIVSAPAAAADLDAGGSAREWILSSMSVGLAAALLASGVLGDTFGRRRAYDVGLALMGIGASLCAAAWAPTALIAGRVLEGAGGAAVLACGLSLLAVHFAPGPERARATSAWGASVGLGIAVGSILAAAVGQLGTQWRETYALTAVVSFGLLGLSGSLGTSRAEHPRRVDVPGLVLLVAGMTLLVSALTQSRDGVSVLTIVLLVLALVSLTGFGVVQTRAVMPLVEPALLRNPGFVAATLGSLTLGVGMIGFASFVPTMVQVGLGRGVWTASLVAADWAVVSVATSLLLRRLPWPVAGPRSVAVVMVTVAAAQLTAVGITVDSGVWRIALAMGLAGLGTGVLNAVLGREAVASVPPDRSAMGSGANNTARYLGAAIGITLFVTVATRAGDSLLTGWTVAVVVSAGLTLLGAGAIWTVGSRGVAAPAERGR